MPFSFKSFSALGLTLPDALTPELSASMPSSLALISASAMILRQLLPVQRMRTFFTEMP
jgi:hypothetical protein